MALTPDTTADVRFTISTHIINIRSILTKISNEPRISKVAERPAENYLVDVSSKLNSFSISAHNVIAVKRLELP